MVNKVVLHFVDGKVQKGTTEDFFPNKDVFHLTEREGREPIEIHLASVKAVYFVKSFEGKAEHQERTDLERVGFGKKIRVQFKDGETQDGYTQGFSTNRPGFFVFPCDPDCNNDRVFVITAATEKINFL
ncbi:MAG TPA: hypothetical protein VL949_07905 [Geobacteraceae bacterium]|nr:hypothetical protein [Geobacteraceae bacterium]